MGWFLLKSLQHQLTTGFAALQLFGLIFEVAPCRPLIFEIKMKGAVGTAQSPPRYAMPCLKWN